MSNPLAFAAVTSVLRARLRDTVGGEWTPELPRTRVVTLPPEHVAVTDESGPIVNVLLYEIRPALDERPAPSTSRSEPQLHPRMRVSLSYLITAHGVLALDADILLGQVVTSVHDTPVITADDIRAMLDPDLDDPTGTMPKVFRRDAVKLADAVERLELALRPLSLAEWAALWRSLGAPYRTSVMLDVSGVVL